MFEANSILREPQTSKELLLQRGYRKSPSNPRNSIIACATSEAHQSFSKQRPNLPKAGYDLKFIFSLLMRCISGSLSQHATYLFRDAYQRSTMPRPHA